MGGKEIGQGLEEYAIFVYVVTIVLIAILQILGPSLVICQLMAEVNLALPPECMAFF